MGIYKVVAGQNLFDVSLALSGSIEGVTDLLMNNPGLSFCDTLKAGAELIYTDDFVVDANILAHNRINGIIPANGERNVYFKSSSLEHLFVVHTLNTETFVSFSVSGTGFMEIDWGDNSKIEQIVLATKLMLINHSFDNNIPKTRKIKFYGNCQLYRLDLSPIAATNIYFSRPVYIEKFIHNNASVDLSFISLLTDVYELELTGLKTGSLLALLPLKKLMKLDLRKMRVDQWILDAYLIRLARENYGRRNCTVYLSLLPSGEYAEPPRKADNTYRISTGMEAIWVITNEASWNEGGYWRFSINDIIYSGENEQDN